MSETETPDEITDTPEEESDESLDDLEDLIKELQEARVQYQIYELAKKHPNGSSLAKKALRDPEKTAESWQFRRKIRLALGHAAIAYETASDGKVPDKETLAEIRADLLNRYLEIVRKQPKKKSKAMRYAAMISIAAHLAPAAPGYYGRLVEDEIPGILTIWERRIRKIFMDSPEIDEQAKVRQILDSGGNASAAEEEKRRKAIEDLIIYSPDKAKELVLSGDIDLSKTWIDQGRFFLQTEFLNGTSKEDSEKATNALKQLKDEIRGDLKGKSYLHEHDQIKIIHKFMRRYGLNNSYRNFYMGDLLTTPEPHQGNCESRAKLALSVVNDIPELGVKDIRLQFMELHVRVLFKMESGTWYAIDNGVFELPEEDITGTAMMDRYAYIRGYLGIQPKGRVLDENKDVERTWTIRERLFAAFALGATSYLAAGAVAGLRSTFDMIGSDKWKRQYEEQEQYEVEIVELNEQTVEKEGLAESYAEAQALLSAKKRAEEKKYRIPQSKLNNARITGDLELKGKEVSDLSQLKAHEVTTLTLESVSVTDFSPLKEAPLEELNLRTMVNPVDLSSVNPRNLRILRLIKTRLEEKSLLKKAPLELLECYDCGIEDLSEVNLNSLRGLIYTGNNQTIIDLQPLRGKQIQELALTRTGFTNLEALADSQIHALRLSEVDFSKVDTAALAKMPLKHLDLQNTNVSDISFLKGKPIEAILLGGTDVSDVSVLSEMPLKRLGIGEKMKDLTPIKALLDRLKGGDAIILPDCFQINWSTYQLEPISGKNKPKHCN